MRIPVVTTLLLSSVFLFGAGPPAQAGAAPEDAAGMLYDRGYRHIRIEPDIEPGYRAWACKSETHFRIEIDPKGHIVDVDPVGQCDPRKGPKKEVRVQAPFTDVRVGEDGVHIKAPFVNLRIR